MSFACSLGPSHKCGLFYYFNGLDYYKSLPRVADILLKQDSSYPQDSLETLAFTLYDLASPQDGYSLYSKA